MQPRLSPIGVSAPHLASARQWERTLVPAFLTWRHTQTNRQAQLESVCDTVGVTLDWWLAGGRVAADAVARRLPAALTGCDQLAFADTSEAMAYFILHLADRYGRGTQALELLLAEGWLPIRRGRMAVLDVGGGPAPGLYAAVDLYDDLAAWAGSTGQPVLPARVSRAHVLDRGAAWDQLLHHFSEHLLGARQTLPGELAAPRLPFRRYHAELGGFSVLGAHHAERARIQRAISREYDLADEPISPGMAWQLAYQEPTDAPSAYDLIVICYFLTNTTMTEALRAELAGLARLLTSGGVLLVLGGTRDARQAIHTAVNELATTAGLRPLPAVSRQLEANPDPVLRDLIATQVRAAVSDIGSAASPEVWAKVERKLRRIVPDDVDHDRPFTMPQFQILAFRRVPSPRRRRQQDH
jgi:hypothetical protein